MVFQPLNYVLAKDSLRVPARKSAAHYDRRADERGLTWLGPFLRNTKVLTGWRCGRGHEFQACYNNIDQGMDCKFSCAKTTARISGTDRPITTPLLRNVAFSGWDRW